MFISHYFILFDSLLRWPATVALGLALAGPVFAAATIGAAGTTALLPAEALPDEELECPIFEPESAAAVASRKQLIEQRIAQARQFAIGDRQRSRKCRLTVDELTAARKSANPLLVDIRRAREFRRFHAAGSINLPGNRAANMRQWRAREIVLIGPGHSYSAIDQLCHAMRDSGFERVFVLEGGVRAWQAKGLKLAGSSPADPEIAEISAPAFFAESAYAHWLLVMPDAVRSQAGAADDYQVGVESVDSELQAVLRQKYEARQLHIGAPPILLVIADDPRQRQALAREALQVSALSFVLGGGVQDYYAHLQKQRVIWSHKPGNSRKPRCAR